MDYPNTSSSSQERLNNYSPMRATPTTSTDKFSLDPELNKPHKIIPKKSTESDEQSDEEPEPQAKDLLIDLEREELKSKLIKELHKDSNEIRQRLGKEVLVMLEDNDNVRRFKEGQWHPSNIWAIHNKLSNQET